MVTDPDDINAGQLVTAETMQKWTDALRELQQLVPPANARASRASTQNLGANVWTALGFSTTDWSNGAVVVGPSGIGVTASGLYEVTGMFNITNATSEASTRRGIGITAASTFPPGTATRKADWWQDVRSNGPSTGPWMTITAPLQVDGGAIITLWAYQDTNATLFIGDRSLAVRRIA